MTHFTCKVDNQGRITLPADWRKSQKVESGSQVTVTVGERGLTVQTRHQALHEAQAIVAGHKRPSRSVVDQLLADRREEARREGQGGGQRAKGLR